MRQLAWLYAAPRTPPPGQKTQAREKSRLRALKDQGREPHLPFVSLPYLLDFLLEIGPTGVGGMSQAPLEFREIEAWERTTGIHLQPWEALAIRQLSTNWCSQADRSTEPGCPAPYSGDATPEEDRAVSSSLKSLIRGMAAS